MGGIFGFLVDPDNAFGRIMKHVSTVIITNLLFLFFSIPVFTLGASYTAMCHVMMKTYRTEGEFSVISEFWEGFRSNFRQSIAGSLISVGILFAGGCLISFLQKEAVWIYIQYVCLFLIIYFLAYQLYFFPCIAAFRASMGGHMRNTFFFLMKKPVISIFSLFCNIVPVALMFLDKVYQPAYVFAFFFFGFSFLNKISMWLILKVFREYLPEVNG